MKDGGKEDTVVDQAPDTVAYQEDMGIKKCYKIIFLRRVCTFVSLYIFSKYIVKIAKKKYCEVRILSCCFHYIRHAVKIILESIVQNNAIANI
jgi:hypothetical protein